MCESSRVWKGWLNPSNTGKRLSATPLPAVSMTRAPQPTITFDAGARVGLFLLAEDNTPGKNTHKFQGAQLLPHPGFCPPHSTSHPGSEMSTVRLSPLCGHQMPCPLAYQKSPSRNVYFPLPDHSHQQINILLFLLPDTNKNQIPL